MIFSMKDFIIYNKVKWLIDYTDVYIINSYSKVRISIKIKKIIKKNRFNSFINCLNEIRKMVLSWCNNEKSKMCI